MEKNERMNIQTNGENTDDEYIFFELNHWSTDFYPNEEPFISWMSDYYETKEDEEKSWIREKDTLDKYCKNNELIMVVTTIDMSVNFCLTAKKSWVLENCPKLLTDYSQFLRKQEDDENVPQGQFGSPFLEYLDGNIGVHYYVFNDDNDCYEEC